MRIAAVFVTYGSRRELLLSAVRSALICDSVRQVIIVDNASDRPIVDDIGPGFDGWTGKDIHIERNSENTGSAGGYAQAIALARSLPNIDAILLLDDDLCVSPTSIEATSERMTSRAHVVFQIPRSDRPEQFAYLNGTKSPTIYKNSFHDFSVANLAPRIWPTRPKSASSVSVEFAPFAGLMLPIEVVKNVDVPNKDLFLYCDDYDYVQKIIKTGFEVVLIGVDPLRSIDASWNQVDRISPAIFDPFTPSTRCYYSVRNRVIFERKYFLGSELIYSLNMISYLVIGALISLFEFRSPRATLKRLNLVVSAIAAGFRTDLTNRRF